MQKYVITMVVFIDETELDKYYLHDYCRAVEDEGVHQGVQTIVAAAEIKDENGGELDHYDQLVEMKMAELKALKAKEAK